jgi:hypothetical protein
MDKLLAEIEKIADNIFDNYYNQFCQENNELKKKAKKIN